MLEVTLLQDSLFKRRRLRQVVSVPARETRASHAARWRGVKGRAPTLPPWQPAPQLPGAQRPDHRGRQGGAVLEAF